MNEKLKAFLTVPPGLALVGALIAAPEIVHALDKGRTPATVAQIAQGKLPSRNVDVTALVLANRGAQQVITRAKSQNSPQVSFFMPIADEGVADGPTLVVVHSFYNEVTDAAEHPDEPLRLEGTVRDVLWEGLEGDVKDQLEALHPLSPDVKLLELGRTQHAGDALWAYGAPLAGLLLGLLYASSVKPKQPLASAPDGQG